MKPSPEQFFDYIVVGGGSAGCVVAGLLSSSPEVTVALLESGPDKSSPLISLPRGNAKLMARQDLTWTYTVEREGAPDEHHVRGRVVGGSGSINGSLYMRGIPSDYDAWNCPGWSWAEMAAAFRAIEGHELGAAAERGGDGPLRISSHPYRQPLCEAALAGCEELGVPVVADVNDGADERMGWHSRTIWKGRRQSGATAFLDPARGRPNFHLRTGCTVERLVFEEKRAVGVKLLGSDRVLRCRREVILCAGAFHTPKLLMLSGIGPATSLAALGIAPLHDSPEVGRNMAEHRLLYQLFDVSHGGDDRELRGLGLVRNALAGVLLGRGVLTRPIMEVGGYIRSRAGLDRPDVQIQMSPFALTLDEQGIGVVPHPSAT